MKKLVKFTSVFTVVFMLVFSMPVTFVSAVTKTVESPKIKVKNVNEGIKISWNKTYKAKKYIIMRKLSTAKRYTSVKTLNTSKEGSYTDVSVKAGKVYNYKVQAVNGSLKTDSKVKEIVRLKTPEIWNRTDTAGCIYFSSGKSKGS